MALCSDQEMVSELSSLVSKVLAKDHPPDFWMDSFETGGVENSEAVLVDAKKMGIFTGNFSVDELQILLKYIHIFYKNCFSTVKFNKHFILFPKCVYSYKFISSVQLLAACNHGHFYRIIFFFFCGEPG